MWLRSAGSVSTAVVQSSVFASGGGTQAVQVDRTANDDARWAVPVGAFGYPELGQPFISISWDMRVEQTTGAGGTFGPFFGVEANDDSGGPVGLLGSLGVDASTGDVLYQAAGTGFLTETGVIVNFGQWNRFQTTLDFITDQYHIYYNQVSLGTFGFVDSGLDRFADADITAVAAAGDPGSLALAGTAYFDNFLVREVPESSSRISLGVALGLATIFAVRRRNVADPR